MSATKKQAGRGSADDLRRKKQTKQTSASARKAPAGHEAESAVRVGTLSFSQEDCYEARWFTDRDLLQALRMVRDADAGFAPELLLLSGARFWSEKDKVGILPMRATQELAEVAGCPVLLEWPGDDAGPSQWLKVTDGQVAVSRNDQYVITSTDVPRYHHLVRAELAAGLGVIEIRGVHFALLICGEAHVLRTKSGLTPPGLEDGWVLLHPSHRPYPPRNPRRGWSLVGRIGQKPPVLQELTADHAGSRPPGSLPWAVIHAGPFRQVDSADDRRVSNIAFAAGQPLTPRRPLTEISGLAALRYAEFSIARDKLSAHARLQQNAQD